MLVLVDTSVWIAHLRSASSGLTALLKRNVVLTHRFVTGELACGNLKNRSEILHHLDELPHTKQAADWEVRSLLDRSHLWGKGVGYVDAHLLAAAMLTDCGLWTLDGALRSCAATLQIILYEDVTTTNMI